MLKPVAMPEVVSSNYGNIIKALSYLARKSIELRTAQKQKEDECEDDDDAGAICEDEDDLGVEIDSDEDDDDLWEEDSEENQCLYDSPLDSVDEVLFLAQNLDELSRNSAEMFAFLMSSLSPEEVEQLNVSTQFAHQ